MPIQTPPPGQPNDARVALVIPSELLEQIRALAHREGRSMSSEIRVAIRQHLERASEEASSR
jgi:predicted DNA-binding protein